MPAPRKAKNPNRRGARPKRRETSVPRDDNYPGSRRVDAIAGLYEIRVGLAAAREAVAQHNAFFVEGALAELAENPLAAQSDPNGWHSITKLLSFRDKHQAMELQDLGAQYGLCEIWSNLSRYADVEEPLEPPLIATAFSGCLNGYTIRSARRESAIVIDEQLIHIANLQGTLLSECFTLREAGRPVADFDIGACPR